MTKEIPLKDNPEFPEINRSLELSNINEPEVGDYNYLNFKMIHRNKETGEISKTEKFPVYRIAKKQNNYFEDFLEKNAKEIDAR